MAIRRAGHELVARMRVLEKTALADDGAVVSWVRELEKAAATAAQGQRGASDLGAEIAAAWLRPRGPVGQERSAG